jgi:hypothetical protein
VRSKVTNQRRTGRNVFLFCRVWECRQSVQVEAFDHALVGSIDAVHVEGGLAADAGVIREWMQHVRAWRCRHISWRGSI